MRYLALGFVVLTASAFAELSSDGFPQEPQGQRPFLCTYSASECRNSCADHRCYGVYQPELCERLGHGHGLDWACYYMRRPRLNGEE